MVRCKALAARCEVLDFLDELLVEAEVPGVDCFLFDLGVSSPQLDIPERGFSYNEDAPLDMRMDPRNNTLTAADVINSPSNTEADIARILRFYGDERYAREIAREIVRCGGLNGRVDIALGNVDFAIGIAMAVGSIPGAIIGANLVKRIPERTLRIFFACFLAVVAVVLVLNEVGVLA